MLFRGQKLRGLGLKSATRRLPHRSRPDLLTAAAQSEGVPSRPHAIRHQAKKMKLSWHAASDADLALLAEWNHQLIRDEGHRNPMTVAQLEERMKGWLHGEYRAVLFSNVSPVGYALFRKEKGLVHLRQFFVRRDQRRAGIGRAAFSILREQVWPSDTRLTVDVLCQNQSAIAFWRSMGYRDYCLTLEIKP
jgi:GNAT superfamily N-acetyltransferase